MRIGRGGLLRYLLVFCKILVFVARDWVQQYQTTRRLLSSMNALPSGQKNLFPPRRIFLVQRDCRPLTARGRPFIASTKYRVEACIRRLIVFSALQGHRPRRSWQQRYLYVSVSDFLFTFAAKANQSAAPSAGISPATFRSLAHLSSAIISTACSVVPLATISLTALRRSASTQKAISAASAKFSVAH